MHDIHADRLNMAVNGSGADKLSGMSHVAACNTCRARLFSAYIAIDRALRGENEVLLPDNRDWPHHYDQVYAGHRWLLPG